MSLKSSSRRQTEYFIFLGAGDLAREVECIVRRRAERSQTEYEIVYYIDPGQAVPENLQGRVYHDPEEMAGKFPPDMWRVVTCAGFPRVRATFFPKFNKLGYRFATIISSEATVDTDDVGEGTIVFPGTRVSLDARIGRNVLMYFNVVVGHDTIIGDHSALNPGTGVGGRVTGGEAVLYGLGCSVNQGRRIGDRAVLAAGAAVWTDVPADATMVGVPAVARQIPGHK